jgi:hypothetical protein
MSIVNPGGLWIFSVIADHWITLILDVFQENSKVASTNCHPMSPGQISWRCFFFKTSSESLLKRKLVIVFSWNS